MSVLVIGAGMVGGFIARFLAQDMGYPVTVADSDLRALSRTPKDENIQTVRLDVSRTDETVGLLKKHDVAVGAMPGRLSTQVKGAAIEARRHLVDISSGVENALRLGPIASECGISMVVDMGIAPGISNMLAGAGYRLLEETDSVLILVGCVPQNPTPPWNYRVSWSLADTLREYLIPARYKVKGITHAKPALSDPELVTLPGVGELEAFLTDGLFTLIDTLPVDDMAEKTLRYKGYAEKIKLLLDTGFLGDTPVNVNGVSVRPIDLTQKVLQEAWRLIPGEEELTVLRVIVKGHTEGKRQRHTFDVLVKANPEKGDTSMSRATGIPCAISAAMILEKVITQKGVMAGEHIGMDEKAYQYMTSHLKKYGIDIHHTVDGDD